MPDFVARFGAPAPETTFSALERYGRERLGHRDCIRHSGDAFQLTSLQSSDGLQFFDGEDGWIAIKGVVYDLITDADASPEAILREMASGGRDINRFEGAFSLVGWDKRKNSAFALNDQAGALNLYYLATAGGIFISSNALLLAKAIGLGLSPEGVAEFLARGVLLAPRTMFEGMFRLNVGEHLVYEKGSLTLKRHWTAFADQMIEPGQVVDRVTASITRAVSLLSQERRPVLCDITGGYDSRLVIASALNARVPIGLTVNGTQSNPDVVIAKAVARKIGLDIHHFDPTSLWRQDIDEAMRRDLVWRSSGELRFVEIYHHFLTRPALAAEYPLHMIGSGGELLRYFPWSQEFSGIGKHQRANIDRAIKYRFIGSPMPLSLVPGKWLPWYRKALFKDIESVCVEKPDADTTQQLDAVYVWKMTGHSTLYLSSLFNWLPTVAPLLTASVIKSFVAIPWRMKLTSSLQREIIQKLSPDAARVMTVYGATAEPPSIGTLHLEARQVAHQAMHAARKFEKIIFRGAFSRETAASSPDYPFWTPSFCDLIDPEKMKSREIYDIDELRALILQRPANGQAANNLLSVATIEQLCLELDLKLDRGFFERLAN